jgi:predicted RNase H-like HicB family nuclease
MTDQLTLEQHLAVPYILDVAAVEDENGDWACRLAYDELPGCAIRAASPVDGLQALERLRERIIAGLVEHGLPVPVPRPPLRI